MAKDKQARKLGALTLNALGVMMAAIVDAMRACDVPNDVVQGFLHELEDGFNDTLAGDARDVMLVLVDILRAGVPGND